MSTSQEEKGHKEVASIHAQDEEHVQALTRHAVNNTTNPFKPESHPEALINLPTGLHATMDVQNSLLNIASTGEEKLERSVFGALKSGETCSFYNPISKSGLKIFADMAKKMKVWLVKIVFWGHVVVTSAP